jgi:nitronate monooxygenase
MTALCDIPIPLIQAPMAGAQGSALAIAVSKAGGLGSLPCALLGPETIRSELAVLRSQTAGPINVNFFCHASPRRDPSREERWQALLSAYYDELGIDPGTIGAAADRQSFSHEAADVIEEFRPEVVSFHFGLPADDLLDRVRSWGAAVVSSATTVDEALWLNARGVDAIIAQGVEAGGHRGIFLSEDVSRQPGIFALLPQIVRAVGVPTIAAGGIADAATAWAAISLGASAVQVGTSYLLCPETATSPVHRAALKSAGARETALTNLFTGRPARGIVNRLMRELGPLRADLPPFPHAAAALGPLRAAAERLGRSDFSPLWAGQNTTGCEEVPAAQVTAKIGDGLEARRDGRTWR